MSDILFAPYAATTLEQKDSIGAKWLRLLDKLDLASAVAGKRTAIKMHFGGGYGFTTIHPFFARKLVEKVKAAGAKEVFATDSPSAVRHAAERGYTAESLGCNLVPVTGSADKYFYTQQVDPPFFSLDELELAGEIVDAQALIDFSHVKGHGAASFGGASKNLSMGCVTERARTKLHSLEGGMLWEEKKCTACKICLENCSNGAITFEGTKFNIFYHDCKLCQHCVLICPQQALKMVGGKYKDFQRGMAMATSRVLETFDPKNVVFINMLMDITLLCDCWGMTHHALVPDIGILAGRDIAAIETASLDLIKAENLIPGTLPKGLEPGKTGHLFERIHGKDPYAVIDYLVEFGHGTKEYKLVEVE